MHYSDCIFCTRLLLVGEFFRQNIQASKLRPARILGGRNRAEISLSFLDFFRGRKRKIVRENFCEVSAGAIAEAGGGARAYDLVQSHHALRACVSQGSVQKKLEFQPKGTAD